MTAVYWQCEMEDENLLKELADAEVGLAEAEKRHGREHPEVAERLLRYASLLRMTQKRTLEAANVEARAKAIRAKLFAEEAQTQIAPVTPLIKPVQTSTNPAIYLGLGGMVVALVGLFINYQYFIIIAIVAVVLVSADVFFSRGTWWRAAIAILFVISGWAAARSVPSSILVDSSPIERLNYASDNAELVANVRTLGKPTQVFAYNLRLPKGFSVGEPQSKDWGRIAIIKGPAHAGSDSAPCIYVLSVIPANDTKKQFKTMPLAKAAKDVVLPLLLQQLGVTAEAKTDKASFQDINGIQFARLGFSVQSGETNTAQTRGFISVAKENNKFVAFCGCDVVPFVTETMDPMEAAVSTVTE